VKYFKPSEFNCKHCGENKMNQGFLDLLDELRGRYGKPMVVSSGYRCPTHNQTVSSTGPNGPHTTGKAVDIAVNRGNAYELAKLAFEMGFSGIGFNQKGEGRFIHLDTISEGRPTIWSY
jgi:zinc D-Ala-D-Ala carboxypeptidase